MHKRRCSGRRRGQESDEEDEEGIGGDRGGELEEEEDGEGVEDGRRGEEGAQGGEEEVNARRGTGGRGGRLITRAPIGLRLRWMIEGKGPPWAQR